MHTLRQPPNPSTTSSKRDSFQVQVVKSCRSSSMSLNKKRTRAITNFHPDLLNQTSRPTSKNFNNNNYHSNSSNFLSNKSRPTKGFKPNSSWHRSKKTCAPPTCKAFGTRSSNSRWLLRSTTGASTKGSLTRAWVTSFTWTDLQAHSTTLETRTTSRTPTTTRCKKWTKKSARTWCKCKTRRDRSTVYKRKLKWLGLRPRCISTTQVEQQLAGR